MSEANEFKRIMLAISKAGGVVFRNNVGMGWIGRNTGPERSTRTVTVKPGDIVIREARPLHAGLFKGSADGIGWKSVIVTQEMVGKRVAIFFSPEGKTKNGRLDPDQVTWMNNVNAAGGIAGVVRTPDEAVALLASVG